MTFAAFLKLTVYLLVLDSLVALGLTDVVSRPGLGAALVAIALSFWVDRLRLRVADYRRLWDLVTVVYLAYAVADALFLADSLITALVHLLLFLVFYKLCNLETSRDLVDVILLTFLQMLAAATLTLSPVFLPVFAVYMLLVMWAMILLHLRRETERVPPDQGRELLAAAPVVTPRLLLTSGATALGSLLLTLVIFFAIPRMGRTYLPFQAPNSPLSTGFSERVELGAYGSIQRDPTIVMRASPGEAEAPDRLDLRWRGVAFDHFDGRAWVQSDARRTPVRRLRSDAFSLEVPRPRVPILSYEIFLEPIGSDVVFTALRPVALRGPLPMLARDGAGGLVLPAAPGARLRYTVVAQPERFRETDLRRAGSAYPAEIRERYLQLPPLAPEVRRLSQSLTAGARTPYDAARSVEGHLARTLRYSLDLVHTPGRDPLEEFLLGRQGGNCEYFATGMAVLLRASGIPARVVNGFQRGEWNEIGRYFAVRQLDAHSWVEVYFRGAGWVAFDPTPRAAFELTRFGSSGWYRKYADALRMRWNRYVVDYSLTDQANVALAVRARALAVRADWRGWWERLRAGVAGAARGVLLAAMLLGLGLAGLWLRRRRRGAGARGTLWRRRREDTAAPVDFYERMLRLLARRGLSRLPALTAREFAAGLAGRPELHRPVRELTELYERARFGGEPLPPGDTRRAADLLRDLAALPS
jgi:transglutaminase-like putative cysteine protease